FKSQELNAAIQPVAVLRHFLVQPAAGTADGVEWHQSMGRITVCCPLEDRGIASGDVSVEISSCQIQVSISGQPLRIMTGNLNGTVISPFCWWTLQDEVLRRRTRGADSAWTRLNLVVHLVKKEPRAWRELWHPQGMKHPAARGSYAWTQPMHDACSQDSAEKQLISVQPGFRRGLSSAEVDEFLFAPDDMCIGVDAMQDSRTVTVQIHFDSEALAVVQQSVPLEELLAANVWEDEIVVFLRGDEQNPILAAELCGRCLPAESSWRLTTSDRYRSRQRDVAGPGHMLELVLRKHPQDQGSWTSLFKRCMQHRLMLRNYDELEDILEALKEDALPPERRDDLWLPELQRMLSEWREERWAGLPEAQTLHRRSEDLASDLRSSETEQDHVGNNRLAGRHEELARYSYVY
ncbi:unnamed protein product, partial [Polarella glacialis]